MTVSESMTLTLHAVTHTLPLFVHRKEGHIALASAALAQKDQIDLRQLKNKYLIHLPRSCHRRGCTELVRSFRLVFFYLTGERFSACFRWLFGFDREASCFAWQDPMESLGVFHRPPPPLLQFQSEAHTNMPQALRLPSKRYQVSFQPTLEWLTTTSRQQLHLSQRSWGPSFGLPTRCMFSCCGNN